MDRRAGAALGGLAATMMALLLAGAPVGGQRWTPPRTPWGDPDLQGNYSNKYEQGTPFERPAQFEGRRFEDITGDELAALVRERATELLLNAPFTGGDPIAGNFGGAPAFYDRFEAGKGSRPWLVVDPPDGRIPPMTPEGRQASADRAAARTARRRGRGPADSYEDRSLYDRCITRGLPGSMMPVNYGNSYRIVQAPGYVAITYEMVHETRVIPLDGRAPLAPGTRQYMGDARGRWEGDTLVVETTNFRDEPAYRGSNPEALRLIERFTPTGPDKVEWSVTVDDPTTWARAWTFSMPLTRNDGEAVFEYACHEGNLAMANLLSAARAEERAAREGTAGGAIVPPEPRRSAPAGTINPSSVLAGTWVAAPQAGRGGRGNFAGLSAPTRIVITETATEIMVETNTGTANQLQAAVYALDGSETVVPGPIGWETRARARWQDGRLVVTVTRTIQGPDGELTFVIQEVYGATGVELTLERTQGSRSQTLAFRRP
jgi:hypothetical protein